MKFTDLNLKTILEFKPEAGKLLIDDDRMLLIRQDAMRTLRQLVFTSVGALQARAIFTQFGFQCGLSDFEMLNKSRTWDTDIDRLACGPMMHSWEGIVCAQPDTIDFNFETGHFFMKGKWQNSYEAEIHESLFGKTTEPVCHTLAGYASGWTTAFFGKPLLCIETMCVCKGDPHCEFQIKPDKDWGERGLPWREALIATTQNINSKLEGVLNVVQQQKDAISQMSTPILQIWEGILVLPVVGIVDTERSSDMTDKLLDAVVSHRARGVLIDITGIDILDTKTADHFIKMAKAVKLLGAESVITGISPAIAQTLTHIDVDLTGIETLRSLRDGLVWFLSSDGETK